MLSAEQARKVALNVIMNDKDYLAIKVEIADIIRKAAYNGKFSVEYTFGSVKQTHIQMMIVDLAQKGYHVSYDTNKNVVIKWKN